MINTANYESFASSIYKVVSISGDKGKSVGFEGKCYSKLAPKKAFWSVWHKNIGKIPEEENTRYYIEEYYKQVLAKLDAEKVYDELDYSILICYEDSEEFCHRHIVAAWFELFLGIKVPEVKVTEFRIQEMKRPENIKTILENVIKENLNMKGFNCIRALYLFEKGNELDDLARKLEEKGDIKFLDCMQAAAYLRSEADACEEVYNNNNKKQKVKSK